MSPVGAPQTVVSWAGSAACLVRLLDGGSIQSSLSSHPAQRAECAVSRCFDAVRPLLRFTFGAHIRIRRVCVPTCDPEVSASLCDPPWPGACQRHPAVRSAWIRCALSILIARARRRRRSVGTQRRRSHARPYSAVDAASLPAGTLPWLDDTAPVACGVSAGRGKLKRAVACSRDIAVTLVGCGVAAERRPDKRRSSTSVPTTTPGWVHDSERIDDTRGLEAPCGMTLIGDQDAPTATKGTVPYPMVPS